VRGTVRLRVRPWGAKAKRVVFRVDGRRQDVDSRAPFLFAWGAKRAKPGKHVLQVVATSFDGREAHLRIPLVVSHPKPRPKPKPKPTPAPVLRIVGQSVAEGQTVSGLVLWKVETAGRSKRVDFFVDGAIRGSDLAAPYTLGWNTAVEAAGSHELTARASGKGRSVEAAVTVTVQSTTDGNAAP